MAAIFVPGLDAESRKRWGLAEDDPGPVSLPKMQFETRRVRRVERKGKAAASAPEGPGLIERNMAALNEGMIDAVGAPVDLVGAGMRSLGIPVGEQPIGGSEHIRSLLHRVGIGQLSQAYDPRSDGEVYLQSGMRSLGEAAAPMGAVGRLGKATRAVGTDPRIATYLKQGFSHHEAKELAERSTGMGHHFIPRNRRLFPAISKRFNPNNKRVLPKSFIESRFNVLKPRGISKGDMYALHFKVDPYFRVAKIPGGTVWRGKQLGLEKSGRLGQLWYGSPRPLKAAIGTPLGVGAGAAYLYSRDEE